ncbi:rho GTPase-activating protein 15 [Musca vetustissima]|uniref:rho GTPase-activating protein 15 n=1 Tax=Musca vetustissima TaxID=27455 RepID=UPI002AB72065|nr:rho GTPase-activating protein 15 [Musca vetustissima]
MEPTTTTALYRNYNEPWFPNNLSSSQQLPQVRESEGMLIATAATAANERRGGGGAQPKTIMKCLRDRTPSSSYTRSNSHIARANGGLVSPRQQPQPLHHPPQREPRPRPIKLTLLKSSSTRDLSRLMELENEVPLAQSSSTANLLNMTSSPSSLSSSASNQQCSGSCLKQIHRLEQRINNLESLLNQQEINAIEMATRLEEFNKKLDLFAKETEMQQQQQQQSPQQQQSKRKKSGSPRFGKKENSSGSTSGGGGSGVVQPSKLVAWIKLSNFWKQRPSIQTLKEQNIYNDEPCFDTEIEMVLKDDVHSTVPKIVVDCCQLIEDKYRKSTEPIEGIYRQCGDYNKMQALRFSIDANDYNALRQSNVDIHTLTGVLKLFLREIKSPLISANEAKTFIGKPNQWVLTDLPNKLEILKRLIRSLPEINRDTLEYLFAHFNRLTKVPLQHISAETLAISITPSIFHTVQQGARMQDIHALLKESEILSDCVKIMIEYHQKIFECTADRKHQKNRISVRNLKKTLSHPDLLFQNLF